MTGPMHDGGRPDRRPIVITGVAGFIGHHTAELLLDLGLEVIGVDSFTPYYSRSLKEANLARIAGRHGFHLVEAPVSPAFCAALFAGTRAVIHLAAQPGVRSSWSEFDTYVDLNIRATKVLLDAALDAGVQRVVYASSSSVYGEAVVHPTLETDPLIPRSPYGITKLAAERLAVAYAVERGLSTVCLRYFTVYGPRQRPDMAIQRLIRAAFTGQAFPLFGDGCQIRDFIHVRDVADANVRAALSDIAAGTVLNVCSEAPATLRDVVDEVVRSTGKSITIDPHEVALGDVTRTTGSARRIRDLLGWEPHTSLAEGIPQQVEAVEEQLLRGDG